MVYSRPSQENLSLPFYQDNPHVILEDQSPIGPYNPSESIALGNTSRLTGNDPRIDSVAGVLPLYPPIPSNPFNRIFSVPSFKGLFKGPVKPTLFQQSLTFSEPGRNWAETGLESIFRAGCTM